MSETASTGAVTKTCPQCGNEYPFEQRFCPSDGTTLRAKNVTGDLVGTIIADRYHVVKKLGEGGMGQVYLAEHVKMGRKSAVKVMNPGMTQDPDAISRFNREASNASRINHANVAAIYDFGETPDGIIYLAMEYVEGDALTKVIETHGALPPRRAGDIMRQCGEALAAAHDLGIVHRDLKPDNIMITRGRDSADLVKVVDFGIAKAGNAENQKVTKTGLVVGTPEYMSPEQLAGDALDGRSDIYSLALVGFNMLTGKLPFPSETVQESMIMRLTDRPRTLAEMHSHVEWPQALQDVLDKALARSAKDRYTNSAKFGHDFATAVLDMPETLTEQGTQVIGAPVVPPTRVASASPPAGAGGTLKQGAVSAPPAVETKKSRTPLIAGAAAVVLALAAGGYFATRPPTPPAVTADTTRQSQQSQTTLPPAGAPAVEPAGTKSDPVASSRPAATSTSSSGSTPSSTPVTTTSFASDLAKIRRLAESEGDQETAGRAIPRIDALMPRLSNPKDIFEAKVTRAVALYNTQRESLACVSLRELASQSDGMKDAELLASFLTSGACAGR